MHLRRTSGPQDLISGSDSNSTGTFNYIPAMNLLQQLFSQLELITDLLGTPSQEEMRYACDGAKSHMMRRPYKAQSLAALYTLSSQANHEAVHLLCQMLVFNPVSLESFKPDDKILT